MGRIRWSQTAIVAAAIGLSGCFVAEELDKGMAIMEAHSPQTSSKASKKEEVAGGEGMTARQKLSAYYAEQRAKAKTASKSTDPKDALVACRIGSSTHFMRRVDCNLRSGRVASKN